VPIPRSLILLLCLLAVSAAGASNVAAQTPQRPAMTRPASEDEAVKHPMNIYDAHGDVDACGPGCNEWIAAEGEIDSGAANRLQRLLVQLNGARLPIFIDSPGGMVEASMALGRLIRARQLTVGVGRTIWPGCAPDSKTGKPCDAGAQLDPLAMCNSGCVFVIAGGAVRLIPPWVKLGIHDLGADPSAAERHSPQFIESGKEADRARLRNYIRFMGIDERLLDKAFAIPNACLGRLTRDDAARFGLDRREFGETVWRFTDKVRVAIRKDFFVRTGSGEPHYIDGLVSLSCGPSADYELTIGREFLPSESFAHADQPPVSIRWSNKKFSLYRKENSRFYLRSTQLTPTALKDIADNATIVLPGTEFGRAEGSAGDITLSMDGFAAAYSKLQKACAQGTFATAAASSAPDVDAPPPGSNAFRPDLPVGRNPHLAPKLYAAQGYECP
jgi:hypothetical protein